MSRLWCQNAVRDHIPLEQGLRQLFNNNNKTPPLVRDHIPLEQGLRRNITEQRRRKYEVRDHIPLEQGLRPFNLAIVILRNYCQRPYSIRTRIKTGFNLPATPGSTSETIFH